MDEPNHRWLPVVSLVDAFVQVNLVRGWRYIDEAGRLMNIYDEVFPEKQVGVEGLRMEGAKTGQLKQLQISSQRIWLHFDRPGSLRLVADQSASHVATICEVLDVTNVRRLGIRANWLIPQPTAPRADEALRGTLSAGFADGLPGVISSVGLEIALKIEGQTQLTLRVAPARRQPEAPFDVPEFAVLADTDVYQASEEGDIRVAEFRRFALAADRHSKQVVDYLSEALEH